MTGADAGRLKIRGSDYSLFPRRHHFALVARTVALSLLVANARPLPAQTRESRPASSYAQPIGVALKTIIIFGDQYNGGDELYDVRITVAEVVRGQNAWQLVKDASVSNKPPGPGFEYLLARVRFEFSARTRPEHYSYALDPAQFTATSADDKIYAPAVLAGPLKPALHATLRSGDSAEGWVAFLVPRGDHTPLMLFREDVGSVIHEGNGSLFKLYDEKSPAQGRAKSS